MPIYVVQKVADALNDAGQPIKGSRSCCSAMAYKATSTTRASRRASRSCASCSQRGGDVSLLRPVGAGVRARRRPPLERRVVGRARRARPTASSCSTPHGEFLEQPLWDERAADRGHAQRRPGRATTSSGSRWPAPRPGGGLHRREAGGARARRGRARSCSRTTGTRPSATQLEGLEARGARVETADIRRPAAPREAARGAAAEGLPARGTGQPAARRARARLHRGDERDRRAARRRGRRRRCGAPLVYASSAARLRRASSPARSGRSIRTASQRDLSHLSKIYAELCLQLYARRAGFELSLLRLGIVYGAEPGRARRARSRRRSWTSSRRLAAAGEELPLDDGGRATIGVVHVEDAARILLESPRSALEVENVVAETITVADVAALAARRAAGGRRRAAPSSSPFEYRHRARGVPVKLLVTGATGFLGSRAAALLRERGPRGGALARPAARRAASRTDAVRMDAGDPPRAT